MRGHAIPINAHRISNKQRRRHAEAAIALAERIHLVFLAVLAEQGGEIKVTNKTLEQTSRHLSEIDWAVVQGSNDNEWIVRLVGANEHGGAEPTVTSEPNQASYFGTGERGARVETGASAAAGGDPVAAVTSGEVAGRP